MTPVHVEAAKSIRNAAGDEKSPIHRFESPLRSTHGVYLRAHLKSGMEPVSLFTFFLSA
ncbi:hypothetical protein SDC9_126468 [bioreactor metagenome]|uniref:Uncharacterized protein n=1 Tax=bioreactor metagenome TaxID=1076179 RepID=A0A645CRB1_9ZZZZ